MVQMLHIGRYAVYTMQLSMVKSQNGNEKALKHTGFPKIMKYVLIDDRFTFQTILYLRILVQCCLQIHTIYNARSCLTRIYLIAWFPHLTHGNKNFFGAANVQRIQLCETAVDMVAICNFIGMSVM